MMLADIRGLIWVSERIGDNAPTEGRAIASAVQVTQNPVSREVRSSFHAKALFSIVDA
jgi:hypothetical protein